MSIEVARASAVVAREEGQRILAEAEAIVRFEYLANRPVRIPVPRPRNFQLHWFPGNVRSASAQFFFLCENRYRG